MCCEFELDLIFLFIMTGVSILIVCIDLEVIKKMFQEYLLITNYIDNDTYHNCYKP